MNQPSFLPKKNSSQLHLSEANPIFRPTEVGAPSFARFVAFDEPIL